MDILLDHNLDWRLGEQLPGHRVRTTKEMGWQRYSNGRLLGVAQASFHVLLTTDVNLYQQQKVERYNLAVVVLRAYDNKLGTLLPLLAQVRKLLAEPIPGKVEFIYADERLRESDKRRGKGPYARLP